ncbi:GNAT family N-acetyltransferase [Nocardiopsis sp. NPDC006198]|uniref:GNAT family N-acetyltransferase n=1 Tax=Nocardiopsis sp. NPDC006198 TaxID=3154472 RepID=UPI0033B27EB0
MGPQRPAPPETTVLRAARIDDPLAAPLVDGLRREYTARYGSAAGDEMTRFPVSDFAPPHGLFLLLLLGGRPVAGGAFRRYDDRTAEVKRMWTASAHRRRGYARLVLAALERAAAAAGYGRVHLTTGPRQPEARGLYLAAGYTPGFDVAADRESVGPLAFGKDLPPFPQRPWHPGTGTAARGPEARPAAPDRPTPAPRTARTAEDAPRPVPPAAPGRGPLHPCTGPFRSGDGR